MVSRVQELMVASNQKAKLAKRREIIKSLKFLRIVGNKLRNETVDELEKRKTRIRSARVSVKKLPTMKCLH